jgi:hypothetical protein
VSGPQYPLVQFSIYEQPLRKIVRRFRGGLVFKAHRLLYHLTLGSRVIKKKKKSGPLRPSRCPIFSRSRTTLEVT